MGGLLALAVGVELFCEVADAVGGVFAVGGGRALVAVGIGEGDGHGFAEFVGGVEVGEWEGQKTGSVVVPRPIFQCATGGQRPRLMHRARQHAQRCGVVQSNCNDAVIWQDLP